MDSREPDPPPSSGFSFTDLVNLPGQDLTDGALMCGPDGCQPATEPGSGVG